VAESATVADLLTRLDPDRREAFVLTQLLGLPYAEAAEVVGCPVGTIRSRVARARADLLTSLAGVKVDGGEGDAAHA
jgi:RNA polymerase sigma-70 factor, ECF subfamily